MTKSQMFGLIVFGLAFVIMFLGLIPWGEWFTSFGAGSAWVNQNLWFISSIVPGFGAWYFADLVMLFLTASVIMGLIFRMKGSRILSNMMIGAQNMFSVAIILAVARAISIVLVYSGLNSFLVTSMTSGLQGLPGYGFVIVIFLVFLILAMFIPSTSGLGGATAGIVSGVVAGAYGVGAEGTQVLIGTIAAFSIALGIINMFIPTQAIVLASMEASHVPYGKALKPILTYAGIIFVVSLILLPAMTALGTSI